MALFPRPPLNPLRGSLCAHTTGCTLFPNSCKTQNFFPSWLTPCSGWLFWKMIHIHPNLGPNVGVSSYQYLLKEFFIPKFIALDGPNQCGHIMKTLKKKNINWSFLLKFWPKTWLLCLSRTALKTFLRFWSFLIFVCHTKFIWVKVLGHFYPNLGSKLCMFGYFSRLALRIQKKFRLSGYL